MKQARAVKYATPQNELRARAGWLPALLLLAACAGGPDPRVAARAFWTAYGSGDRAALEAASIPGSADELELSEHPEAALSYGEPLVSPSRAAVPTTVDAEGERVEFETRLERVDDRWKVDAQRSARARQLTELAAENPIQAALVQGLEAAFGGLGREVGGALRAADAGASATEAPRREAALPLAGTDTTNASVRSGGWAVPSR